MEEETQEKPSKLAKFKHFYETQYKKLLIIPFALLFIAILLIGIKYATTGDFINRDVSLKGGVTVTVPVETDIDVLQLENNLINDFPGNDIGVRTLSKFGSQVGFIVEADITQDEVSLLLEKIRQRTNLRLTEQDFTIEVIGSSLGSSFFKEIIISLLIAFLFMGIVVFFYFRTFVPSIAVILAAFSDIVVTLAIANLLNFKLSSAGIAAFLMLIGYSVDTDILLSTRVLKRKEGSVMDRIYGSAKTGLTMSVTTIVAIFVALFFAQSEVIRQIMSILLIGLFVDLINTWIQNVGLLRLYLERKERKHEERMNNEP
jgi:preprotein translocase subunit SecF